MTAYEKYTFNTVMGEPNFLQFELQLSGDTTPGLREGVVQAIKDHLLTLGTPGVYVTGYYTVQDAL